MSFWTTEVCSPRISTWLASFRVSQITFPVILLFTFRKHERSAALRTCDIKVWHRGFSTRVVFEDPLSALRSAGVAFLSTTSLWDESAVFSNATPKSWRPDGLVGLSVLQPLSLFKFLCDLHKKKCGKTSPHVIINVEFAPHGKRQRLCFPHGPSVAGRTAHV